MDKLLERIESYNFECEAGPLTKCADWLRLKSLLTRPEAQGETPCPTCGEFSNTAKDIRIRELERELSAKREGFVTVPSGERIAQIKHDPAVSAALDAYAAAIKAWGVSDNTPSRVMQTEEAVIRAVIAAAPKEGNDG